MSSAGRMEPGVKAEDSVERPGASMGIRPEIKTDFSQVLKKAKKLIKILFGQLRLLTSYITCPHMDNHSTNLQGPVVQNF